MSAIVTFLPLLPDVLGTAFDSVTFVAAGDDKARGGEQCEKCFHLVFTARIATAFADAHAGLQIIFGTTELHSAR